VTNNHIPIQIWTSNLKNKKIDAIPLLKSSICPYSVAPYSLTNKNIGKVRAGN
jgi:hypothetical protein